METRPEKLSIACFGAGNLATHLLKALHHCGCRIVQVYSRTEESASTLAQAVGASWTTDLASMTAEAQLCIVALKDAALVELLPQLVACHPKALWVHTAGSLPMSIWQGEMERYGVFYPMQTFSKQREVDFNQIPIFIEARYEEDARLLKWVASLLSERVYEANSEQRKALHLAAVFSCNFANHMYLLAAEVLRRHGLPFDILLPLIDETARKVHQLPPHAAQTGPAVRYDENIIRLHRQMLADEPEAEQLYRLISENIHRLNG